MGTLRRKKGMGLLAVGLVATPALAAEQGHGRGDG